MRQVQLSSFSYLGTQQALNRLARLIAAGDEAPILVSNTLFVDMNGDDATAIRGDLSKPFATIQAALDAAQTGDVVFVRPGLFVENITWPDVDNVTLTSDWGATIQSADGSLPAILKTGTYSIQGMLIKDIYIEQTSGEGSNRSAIEVNGELVPDYSMLTTSPLVLDRVVITGGQSIRLSTIGDVVIRDSIVYGEQYLSQVGHASYHTTKCDVYDGVFGTIEVSFVGTDPYPAGTEGKVEFEHCMVDWLIPHSHVHVEAYHTEFNTIYSTDMSNLLERVGGIKLFHCQWNDELSINGAFNGEVPPVCCEGYNCHAGTLTRIYGGSGVLDAIAIFRNTDFQQLIANGSTIDANQCHLVQSTTTAPNGGSIDRDVWVLPDVVIPASPGAAYAGSWINYFTNSGLTAFATVHTALGSVEFPVGITFTGFTVGGSVAGVASQVTADITIIQTK